MKTVAQHVLYVVVFAKSIILYESRSGVQNHLQPIEFIDYSSGEKSILYYISILYFVKVTPGISGKKVTFLAPT